MKYTKKKFLEDVAKEARAIKKHATEKEILNLSFENLNVASFNNCIYGQMTGDCTKQRGVELIETCCKRYVDLDSITRIRWEGWKAISRKINGTKPPSKRYPGTIKFLSSIEAYIAMPTAKNENLIAYLKGERKDLVL